MNLITVSGTLADRPRLRETPHGAVAVFALRVQDHADREPLVLWCEAWDRPGQQLAQRLHRYGRPGTRLEGHGKLRWDAPPSPPGAPHRCPRLLVVLQWCQFVDTAPRGPGGSRDGSD